MERAELPHSIAYQHLLPRRQVGDRLTARWKDHPAPLAPACSTALRSAVLASMETKPPRLPKQGVVAEAAAAIAGAGGLRLSSVIPQQHPATLSLWEQIFIGVGVESEPFDALAWLGCDRLGSPLISQQAMNDCCERMQLMKG
jgi:hypothetical protein